MGLYLCILDAQEEEIDAVEVGSYADYGRFIEVVVREVEGAQRGTVCPTLTLHHDSDGQWSPTDCRTLKKELAAIEAVFREKQAMPFESEWMKEVARERGITPKNLADSFIDVEGDRLIERLANLCDESIQTELPILFQ